MRCGASSYCKAKRNVFALTVSTYASQPRAFNLNLAEGWLGVALNARPPLDAQAKLIFGVYLPSGLLLASLAVRARMFAYTAPEMLCHTLNTAPGTAARG